LGLSVAARVQPNVEITPAIVLLIVVSPREYTPPGRDRQAGKPLAELRADRNVDKNVRAPKVNALLGRHVALAA
jgi:hypothetical protein